MCTGFEQMGNNNIRHRNSYGFLGNWYLYKYALPGACNWGRVHSVSSPFVQNASVQPLRSSSSVNWSANHINCQERLVLRSNSIGNICNKKLIRPFNKRSWPQYHPFQAFQTGKQCRNYHHVENTVEVSCMSTGTHVKTLNHSIFHYACKRLHEAKKCTISRPPS